MTILYRPVLIESTEQAEALPIGTVGHEPPGLYAYIKQARDYWKETGHEVSLADHEMLPFTALVPIEAEEVRVIEHGLIELDVHGQEALYREPTPGSRDYRRTEYHTPWEEV